MFDSCCFAALFNGATQEHKIFLEVADVSSPVVREWWRENWNPFAVGMWSEPPVSWMVDTDPNPTSLDFRKHMHNMSYHHCWFYASHGCEFKMRAQVPPKSTKTPWMIVLIMHQLVIWLWVPCAPGVWPVTGLARWLALTARFLLANIMGAWERCQVQCFAAWLLRFSRFPMSSDRINDQLAWPISGKPRYIAHHGRTWPRFSSRKFQGDDTSD